MEAGIADKDTPYEEVAEKFIEAVKDMKKLSRYADKEANPLYPVPVLMNEKELEQFYYLLME